MRMIAFGGGWALKHVTSAGFAGTDKGLYLVSRLAGRAAAENAVTAATEYDWHPK